MASLTKQVLFAAGATVKELNTISDSTETAVAFIESSRLVVVPKTVTVLLAAGMLINCGCSELARTAPEITLLAGETILETSIASPAILTLLKWPTPQGYVIVPKSWPDSGAPELLRPTN